MKHTTSNIFMVEPTNFRMNEQTSITNSFQSSSNSISYTQQQILCEFRGLVSKLESVGISVHVEKDIPERDTPDSIFPNNWVSFHDDGSVFLFPMLTENRRRERNLDFVLNVVKEQVQYESHKRFQLRRKTRKYFMGTGSVVFDHMNNIAFCILSERSSKDLFVRLCQEMATRLYTSMPKQRMARISITPMCFLLVRGLLWFAKKNTVKEPKSYVCIGRIW